jgi:DNA sulfur modification protein DndC
MRQSLDRMGLVAQKQNLPFIPQLLQPEVKDTFWVNLIGKGYPAPRHMFRWCTERLKIWPSNRYIQNVVRVKGEVIVVLGTRKAESVRRAGVMNEHEVGTVGDRLKKTKDLKSSLLYRGQLPNSLVYSPLANWRDDEVWVYLMQFPNPWRHSNKDLFTLYRGATEDNECPFVIDTSTPSCGDSRFGCWVCTLVSEDKSMSALIENGLTWLTPLLKFRNELAAERNIIEHRMPERRNGTAAVNGMGPYYPWYRAKVLERLFETQKEIQKEKPHVELITNQELVAIQTIWYRDFIFNQKVSDLYRKAYKINLDMKDQNEKHEKELELLKKSCEDNPTDFDLIQELLTLQKNKSLSIL